eukprot:2131226-Lingulodinium_polyedra.AAC.1
MLLAASFSRPWILAVRRAGAVQRVLADDTRVFAHGHDALDRSAGAFRIAHEFVRRVGGAIAPAKS